MAFLDRHIMFQTYVRHHLAKEIVRTIESIEREPLEGLVKPEEDVTDRDESVKRSIKVAGT